MNLERKQVPVKEVTFRKKTFTIEQPEVGCIAVRRDAVHTCYGEVRNCVVTRVWKNKDGVCQTVELHNITAMTDTCVLAGTEYRGKLSLYVSQNWPRWSDNGGGRDDYYWFWNEYREEKEENLMYALTH